MSSHTLAYDSSNNQKLKNSLFFSKLNPNKKMKITTKKSMIVKIQTLRVIAQSQHLILVCKRRKTSITLCCWDRVRLENQQWFVDLWIKKYI